MNINKTKSNKLLIFKLKIKMLLVPISNRRIQTKQKNDTEIVNGHVSFKMFHFIFVRFLLEQLNLLILKENGIIH